MAIGCGAQIVKIVLVLFNILVSVSRTVSCNVFQWECLSVRKSHIF